VQVTNKRAKEGDMGRDSAREEGRQRETTLKGTQAIPD